MERNPKRLFMVNFYLNSREYFTKNWPAFALSAILISIPITRQYCIRNGFSLLRPQKFVGSN